MVSDIGRRHYLTAALSVFFAGCSAADEVAEGAAKKAAKGAAKSGDEVVEQAETTTESPLDREMDSNLSDLAEEASTVTVNGHATENWGTLTDSIERTLEIPEGHYNGFEFSVEESGGRFEYQLLLRSGPRIDAYLLEQDELEFFENGERFSYISGASQTNAIEADVNFNLVEGSYVLLLDNSELGETAPIYFEGDESTATITLEAAIYE